MSSYSDLDGRLTIEVVFDGESESELENASFLHPNPKCYENDLYGKVAFLSLAIPFSRLIVYQAEKAEAA